MTSRSAARGATRNVRAPRSECSRCADPARSGIPSGSGRNSGLYNGQLAPGETLRVFPLSNWTELDVWTYIQAEGIDVVPLYFAAMRPTVERDGALIVVDDERMRFEPARARSTGWSGSARSAAIR